MVAAAKLRRAKEKAEAAGPYADRMLRMLATLASNIDISTAPKLLAGTGKKDTHLLVVVSSDRGLCGALNSSLFKKIRQELRSLVDQGKSVKILVVGKKAREYFERDVEFGDKVIHTIEGISKKKDLGFGDAEQIAEKIIATFEDNSFDVCRIFYNKFVNSLVQEVTDQQLIPLKIEEGEDVASDAVYDFEPSEEKILETLLPRNVAVQIYHALLENLASEQGARMTAMDNATRNAGDMIKGLTLVYNRTRQAVITKELIEIISGAEAV